jgi:hypothetical protein
VPVDRGGANVWFRARCPVVAEEQCWIDDRMTWFADKFGTSWLSLPMVTPTDDFFPGPYSGTVSDVRRAVATVCTHLEIEPRRVSVQLHSEIVVRGGRGTRSTTTTGRASMTPTGSAAHTYRRSGMSGSYRRVAGKVLLSLDESLAQKPLLLIATIAHELAHEQLAGRQRRSDLEPLADLLTVYQGFGIITANATLEFSHVSEPDHPRSSHWSADRLGYLTEPMYGYALARYAVMRGELCPDWIRFVDSNPRRYLKRGLRFLRA